MGEFAVGRWIKIVTWLVAAIIIGLNINLIIGQIGEWISKVKNPLFIDAIVIPFILLLGLLLVYIIIRPWLQQRPLHWSQQERLRSAKSCRHTEPRNHSSAQGGSMTAVSICSVL